VDDGVPSFIKGQGKGWVTGEYGMLPRATEQRHGARGHARRPSGRTLEIQRLIGVPARHRGPAEVGRKNRVARL